MKKLYSEIKQYSVDGKLINTFESSTEAHHIAHKDSIISCCKGKHKIAGGYVWRFDNSPFEREETSKISKNNITCHICNSCENPKSMSMHLKHHHNMKNNEYIEKYGEFRPKHIISQKKLNESEIKCEICNEKLLHNRHLMFHINKNHPGITKSEYIIKYKYKDNIPLCKCGCGGFVTLLENGKNCDLKKDTYNRDYIKGHWDWKFYRKVKGPSLEQIEITNFIRSIYDGEIKTDIKRILNGNKELDIYLPNMKLAIEYNGLFWHSEKSGKYEDYHLNKYLQASKKNIRLIQIFADEWYNKKEIVKAKIRSIFRKSEEKTYARKCYIKEIESKEKNKFLNFNHIQGEDRSSIKLGLFENNILIGVMSFSKPRLALGSKIQPDKYELSRFATSKNIVGGASKLLKHFIKNYNPINIYSYSDNRWTDPNNNMYLKLNFKITKTSSPGYWYTKNYKKRIHRYNFNKFILKKMGADVVNKTEREIMIEWGYTRIWDCGTTRYELNMN